jgi:hypothetical protein
MLGGFSKTPTRGGSVEGEFDVVNVGWLVE